VALALAPQLGPLEVAIQELVEKGTLRVPPYPAVAVRVQEALGRSDTGLGEIAQLVGADAALAAAILRCANSALYRRGPPLTDLLQAITRVGAAEVMRLLVASGLSAGAQAAGPLVSVRRSIWIEGLASAVVCQELARLRGLRTEEAFTVGLLHDFGKIVAIATMEAILDEEKIGESFSQSAWVELVDRLHVPVGQAMAARWGLPPLVTEVIGAHHGGGVACRDQRQLEVVRLSDAMVNMLLMRPRVEGSDLAAVQGIAPQEREPLAKVIEQVPDFVASFETPASAAFVPHQRVTQPETTFPFPPGCRDVKLGVSISVARRPRLYSGVSIGPDGLVVQGEEPLPVNRLLEAKLYAEEPFTVWVRTRLCKPVSGGYRAEISPFALSGALRALWETLVTGEK